MADSLCQVICPTSPEVLPGDVSAGADVLPKCPERQRPDKFLPIPQTCYGFPKRKRTPNQGGLEPRLLSIHWHPNQPPLAFWAAWTKLPNVFRLGGVVIIPLPQRTGQTELLFDSTCVFPRPKKRNNIIRNSGSECSIVILQKLVFVDLGLRSFRVDCAQAFLSSVFVVHTATHKDSSR